MRRLETSAYELAQRFIGLKEVAGKVSNPAILAMLRLDNQWPEDDAVPWCSAFLNYIAWLLRLPRSKSLRARSWLFVGHPVSLLQAEPGFDVVIFSRGKIPQPGPDILGAPGHVGLFAGVDKGIVTLGGNQGDAVSLAIYPTETLLGVRRLR